MGKILIVDDNPVVMKMLQDILKKDYDLQEAVNGEDALDMAASYSPDVVLLDIVMPGMNGYEVCKKMRLLPELRFTKIIMISSKASLSERLEGYDAGADDYIAKPFDRHEILAKIRVYLQLSTVQGINHMKSDLITLISHEICTPLNGLIPLSKILMKNDDLNEMARKRAERLYEIAQLIHNVYQRIVHLSNFRNRTIRLKCSEADLGTIVHDAADEIAVKAEKRGLTLGVEVCEDSSLQIDQDVIKSSIMAVLDNSVHFSRPGRIEVIVFPDGLNLCLKIVENGGGIDPESTQYLFDAFSGKQIERHADGQRLELAIAHYGFQLHGGTAEAKCMENGSLVFKITLPKYKENSD